jgi:hypothetical protein
LTGLGFQKFLKSKKMIGGLFLSILVRFGNPLAHNNPNFLSDADKNLAEGYCKILLEKIIQWKQSVDLT